MSLTPTRFGDSGRLKPHAGSRLKEKPKTPAPGDYDVGSKHDVKYKRAPASQFGGNLCRIDRDKTGLRADALQRADDPGPLSYNASAAKQKIDQQPRTPSVKFGSSERRAASKIYIHRNDACGDVADPNRYSAGCCSPGPSSYEVFDSSIVEHVKRKAPAISFGLRTPNYLQVRTTTGDAIGPGSYEQSTSMGPQVSSKKTTTPGFSMGSTDRHKLAEVLSPDFSPNVRGPQSPGPTSYDAPSGMGRQLTSTKPSSQSFSFGSEGKLKRNKDNHVPGPGSYAADSMLGLQADSKRPSYGGCKFGTSQRPDTASQTVYSPAFFD